MAKKSVKKETTSKKSTPKKSPAKKNTSSKINLILIKGIGKTLLNYNFSQDRLKKFFKEELVN